MKTRRAIKKVINYINNTPQVFNSEDDVHAMLYRELVNEYPTKVKTILGYETVLVHTEYIALGTKYRGKGERLDLVVFSKEDARNVNNLNLTLTVVEGNEYRPVKLRDAIEVKVDMGFGGNKNRKIGVDKDIKKLLKIKSLNICQNIHFIYICRWPTKNIDKQNEINALIDDCNKKDINFYYNDYKKIFKTK